MCVVNAAVLAATFFIFKHVRHKFSSVHLGHGFNLQPHVNLLFRFLLFFIKYQYGFIISQSRYQVLKGRFNGR